MSRAKRKPSPQPPWWYLLATDDCYGCKNRNNCNRCKRLKREDAFQKKKRERAYKSEIMRRKYCE